MNDHRLEDGSRLACFRNFAATLGGEIDTFLYFPRVETTGSNAGLREGMLLLETLVRSAAFFSPFGEVLWQADCIELGRCTANHPVRFVAQPSQG